MDLPSLPSCVITTQTWKVIFPLYFIDFNVELHLKVKMRGSWANPNHFTQEASFSYQSINMTYFHLIRKRFSPLKAFNLHVKKINMLHIVKNRNKMRYDSRMKKGLRVQFIKFLF